MTSQIDFTKEDIDALYFVVHTAERLTVGREFKLADAIVDKLRNEFEAEYFRNYFGAQDETAYQYLQREKEVRKGEYRRLFDTYEKAIERIDELENKITSLYEDMAGEDL